MQDISHNLNTIRQELANAAELVNKSATAIKLIAVSKNQSVAQIQQAIAAGQNAFGENYVQEALPKINALSTEELEWHFIGKIQSNKTRILAEHFAWVQTVTSYHVAERLNVQRPALLQPLNICLQVNISAELSKNGITTNEIITLATQVAQLPNIRLRGLMAIPAQNSLLQIQNDYHNLYQLFLQLQQMGFSVDTLSMGMSNDFAIAIAAGSTMVRVGTALFGART